MALPIGIQLYSVREQLKTDYAGTIRKIAEMGYVGVETAGFPGSTVAAAKALFAELGLQTPSAHAGLPVGPDANKSLDEMAALGCQNLISGKGPDDFATADKIKATCDLFNQASANAAARGLNFGVHNHWWEYIPVEGQLAYQIMLKHLDPRVFFEIDTYWVTVAGQDAAKIVAELGERVRFLHIKDGPTVKGEPMTAAGQGKMNFPPIVKAAKHAEWLIVELDSCATDMLTAVGDSIEYLAGKKLGKKRTAKGKKK